MAFTLRVFEILFVPPKSSSSSSPPKYHFQQIPQLSGEIAPRALQVEDAVVGALNGASEYWVFSSHRDDEFGDPW